MKTRWLLPLCALCLVFDFGTARAQQNAANTDNVVDSLQIDPRQYVKVFYRKSASYGKTIPIWNWQTSKSGIPNQKAELLDVNGLVRIEFMTGGIIKNNDFEGTVSLEAEISGANGTRKIEVNPYSEVGVQRVPIGIKSEPPSEIAKKLLNMLRTIKDADTTYRRLLRVNTFKVADTTYQRLERQGLESLSTYIKSQQFDEPTARKKLDDFENSLQVYLGIAQDTAYHGERLKNFVQEKMNQYNAKIAPDKRDYQDAYKLACLRRRSMGQPKRRIWGQPKRIILGQKYWRQNGGHWANLA